MSFSSLLKNKVVVITGGSRGLGKAMCECFARHGASIGFNYLSDSKSAEETVSGIELSGGKANAYQCSVTDEIELENWVKRVEDTIGSIDVLINNAGISQPLPIALVEPQDWDKVSEVNLKGQYMAVRAVLPGMIKRRKGVVLNIGSLAGLRLIEAPVHYSATKAGSKGFTEALCKEVARYNIRVNCLAPGLLSDGVGKSLPQHRLQNYINHIAMRRVGEPNEVAEFAAFLVSDKNSYMNGATVMMDGGF